MYYFHWIVGTILALAWFSRIVDAALGMPSVADISQPEWDRKSTGDSVNRRVSIIVPARNEEEDIELSLTRLLELDYDNYEVIAVNDRSTDRTGEIMERVAENPVLTSRRLRVIHHRELRRDGWERPMPCGRRRMRRPATGSCLPTLTFYSSRIPCGGRSLTPRRKRRITWCYFRG